jgi:hypothetical protein
MADFTEIYKQSNSLVSYSKNGEYVATSVQQRLVIRETHSMEIIQLYACADDIQYLEFSSDNDLLLVCSYKNNGYQVFSTTDETWTAQFNSGTCGLSKVMWAPDARHILAFSEFDVFLFKKVSIDSLFIDYRGIHGTGIAQISKSRILI